MINTQYDHVTEEFSNQKELLDRQIISIELRQQEIQLHITTIDQANNQLDILISQEQNNKQKGNYFRAKTQNVELLTKLYSVYREFEDTKYKYHNNISDMINKEHRLIEVDVRRIDEKLEKMSGDDMVDMFKSLTTLLSGNNSQSLPKEVNETIQMNNDEYQL